MKAAPLIKVYGVILLLATAVCGHAQEGLVPLNGNLHYLYGDLQVVPKNHATGDQKARPATGVIKLPFIDDFSYADQFIYPDSARWTDDDVYVNTGFPIAPPSIGVATFDGLNRYGYPYTNPKVPNLAINGPADTLTSKKIDLFTTASSKTLTLADSIGLSFYYQARGNGEAPEAIDSLILDFYNPALSRWQNRVWFSRGNSNSNTVDSSFKRAFVMIRNTDFLSDKFRFRFRNKATNSGNFDHWNLDYVYLDMGRNMVADTLYNDVTFATVPTTFLKNYYVMPFEQYNSSEITKKNSVLLQNNYNAGPPTNGLINIYYQLGISQGTNNLFSYSAQAANIPPYITGGYFTNPAFANPAGDPAFTYVFPNMTDSTDYTIKHFVYRSGANNDFLPVNDTVYQYQRFRNYYAIDDGAPEAGYYVLGAGGQMAIKIRVNVTDTFRSLRVYFDPAPIGTADKFYFKIRVYDDNNGPGTAIYAPNNVYFPNYIDGVYHKAQPDYELPVPLVLQPGTYYIAIQQQLSTGLVVGWDKNTDASGSIFYSTGNGWAASGIKGALMMHPVFGKKVPNLAGIKGQVSDAAPFQVYPNPASSRFTIAGSQAAGSEYHLLNMLGQEVLSGALTETQNLVHTADLPPGIYMLTVAKGGHTCFQQKIILGLYNEE